MLTKACGGNRGLLDGDLCAGYVLAAYDVLTVSRLLCVRPGVSTEQVMAIGRKYLADHPEAWDLPPSVLLKAAFTAAFPCEAH